MPKSWLTQYFGAQPLQISTHCPALISSDWRRNKKLKSISDEAVEETLSIGSYSVWGNAAMHVLSAPCEPYTPSSIGQRPDSSGDMLSQGYSSSLVETRHTEDLSILLSYCPIIKGLPAGPQLRKRSSDSSCAA